MNKKKKYTIYYITLEGERDWDKKKLVAIIIFSTAADS